MKILPVPSEKYFRQGYVAFQKGDFIKASAHFEKALKINPTNELASFFLGVSKLETGDRDASKSHLEQSVKAAPDFYASHVALGLVYAEKWAESLDTGEPDKHALEKAILSYENALDLKKDDKEVTEFLNLLKDSRQ